MECLPLFARELLPTTSRDPLEFEARIDNPSTIYSRMNKVGIRPSGPARQGSE